MKKKVIVAGHICLDITPVIPETGKRSLGEALLPGKLVETEGVSVSTGGAVANTGLAMKIFGADVRLLGKIGRDEFGDLILGALKRYDGDKDMLRAEREATSYTVVLAVPGVDRVFLHCPGANHSYLASDVPEEYLKEASLFHFGYPPLMRSMYQNDGEELLRLMQRAKAAGCATSLDLAAVDADSEAGRADWETILGRVLPYVDFFLPSVEEVCFMLDKTRFSEWKERAADRDITEILDADRDLKPLGEGCMELGAKVLLLKCGAKGLYYRTSGKERLKETAERLSLDTSLWAGKEGFTGPYKPKRILSGTGAGDVCIAAFLTSVLEGGSLSESVSLAAAAGAVCVSSYDALSALMPLEELKEMIKTGELQKA